MNFRPIANIENKDFNTKVRQCTFYNAAEECGLGAHAKIYCRNVDYKILERNNPVIKLILKDRLSTGKNRCIFCYNMKVDNK